MNDLASLVARTCWRRPLAVCFASMFALSMPALAIADTWIVTSCDEGSSGDNNTRTGTLRYALRKRYQVHFAAIKHVQVNLSPFRQTKFIRPLESTVRRWRVGPGRMQA